MSDPEADLWRFALAVYGTEGVAGDCLNLQERYGVDVPVMLCALWMARRGTVLDADEMARLATAVAPWHGEVVRALRAVRQRLKQGPPPAPTDRTEKLRSAVKAAELDAERIELATLAHLADSEFAVGPPVPCIDNLIAALAHYAGGSVDSDAPIDRLVEAAEATADS